MWRIVNISIIASTLVYAYLRADIPDAHLHGVTSGAYIALLLMLPPTLLLGTHYGIALLHVDPLPRPSLSRNPFRIWGDPLQFISTAAAVSLTSSLSVFLHRAIYGHVGQVQLWLSWACSGGLLGGLALVCLVFRKRIVKEPES